MIAQENIVVKDFFFISAKIVINGFPPLIYGIAKFLFLKIIGFEFSWDVNQPILLVTDTGFEEEAVTRLSRVGFDNIMGHLKGGFLAWLQSGKQADIVDRITAAQFAKEVVIGKDKVIDVRKETEYAAEHVEEAYNRPLAAINDWIKDINPEEHFFIHCAGGYRSMIASSILQARGYRNFTEVGRGFKAISERSGP